MPSYRYNSYKFAYTRDDGEEEIKTQREYKDPNTGSPFVEVSPLFLTRVITSNVKITRSDTGLRYASITIPNANNVQGKSVFKHFSPFQPDTPEIGNHLREILDIAEGKNFQDWCVDYYGESKEYI